MFITKIHIYSGGIEMKISTISELRNLSDDQLSDKKFMTEMCEALGKNDLFISCLKGGLKNDNELLMMALRKNPFGIAFCSFKKTWFDSMDGNEWKELVEAKIKKQEPMSIEARDTLEVGLCAQEILPLDLSNKLSMYNIISSKEKPRPISIFKKIANLISKIMKNALSFFSFDALLPKMNRKSERALDPRAQYPNDPRAHLGASDRAATGPEAKNQQIKP